MASDLMLKTAKFLFQIMKKNTILENEPFTLLVNPWGFGRTEDQGINSV